MGVRDEMVGQTYGRWTVISADVQRYRVVIAECECGTVKPVHFENLLRGRSSQCPSCARTTHGMTGTRVHRSWITMRRGGDYVPRWRSFSAFEADVGHPATADQRLHRLDPSKPWGPGNGVWMNIRKSLAICASRSLAGRVVGPFDMLGRTQRSVLEVLSRTGPLRLTVLSGFVRRPTNILTASMRRLKRRGLVRKTRGAWELARSQR